MPIETKEAPKDFEVETGKKEDEVLFNDSAFITFGSKPYPIKKPSIRQTRAWRQKVLALDKRVQEEAKIAETNRRSGEDPGQVNFLEYLNESYFPAMAEIIVSYCPENGLSIDIVENEGTDDELIEAYRTVLNHGRVPFEKLRLN